MNLFFMPMFFQGLAGLSRRMVDGGSSYAHSSGVIHYNEFMMYASWGLAVAQLPFMFNIVMTLLKKRDENPDPNPWQATTLEWVAAPSPPIGHGNFPEEPTVYRGPYEYSVPGADTDFSPQNKKD